VETRKGRRAVGRIAGTPRRVRLVRLSDGLKRASIARIEQRQRRGAVIDLVRISDKEWDTANWRLGGVKQLIEQPGPLMPRLKRLANLFGVSPRTLRRWVRAYRRDPDILCLLPKSKGPRLGHRRLTAEAERLVREVIDAWVARTEPLPVAWIVEECGRRAKSAGISKPSRTSIDARLRDRGLEGLDDKSPSGTETGAAIPTPRSSTPLAVVQIDHTLVDVMVVDEIHRQSMGRPWITAAFDIATRAVLGFHLSLHAPSAVSVGMTLAMVGLPKDRWLKDRSLTVDWPMFGIPRLLHLDNGVEFHSLALSEPVSSWPKPHNRIRRLLWRSSVIPACD
jgi:putative transposase